MTAKSVQRGREHPFRRIPWLMILTAGLLIMTAACSRSAKSNTPAQPVATIIAEPNPVPAGPGSGKTTISWSTGDGSVGDVYLLVKDEEKLFGRHSKDSKQVDWIASGATYEFRLYDGPQKTKLLSSVKVTRKR